MLSCANAPKRRDVRGRETDSCKRVDRTLEAMGLRILKTPVRAPQANAFCERVIGTIRRESNGGSIPARCRVAATPILSGLHHEYRLERHAA